MKILFSSYTFAPNVGGIESVSAILAENFAEAGYEIEVVTETLDEENVQRPTPNVQRPMSESNFRLTRRPSVEQLLRLVSWCDLLFQNNISLRSLIPALLLRKRAIVVHQTWLRSGWSDRIKRALLPRVTNVAISEAIRDHINVPARVVGNPFDDRVFRLVPGAARDKTLVFVGRLVSDKGLDVLLQALKHLQRENLRPDLTIIGSGPEEQTLRRLATDLGLDRQVIFAGKQSGDELARLLNQHRILVVPSRWPEPFGVVALEGIACGCVVVGSSGGGLSEAIGPCGNTFENGDERALVDCLRNLLLDPQKDAVLRKEARAHLEKFRVDSVAAAYLALIRQIP